MQLPSAAPCTHGSDTACAIVTACSAAPCAIALHRPGGYTAASLARVPPSSDAWEWPPGHLFDNASSIAGAELMKRVGFCAGAWPPACVLVCRPKAHWCATTALTPDVASNLAIVGWLQLVAPAGCSWRKCLPASTCSWYTAAAKTSNTSAARRCSFHSTSPFLALRFWSELNMVHGGEPMTRNGSSERMRSKARLRSRGFWKSHFTPSTSAWRSKVEPATKPMPAGRA